MKKLPTWEATTLAQAKKHCLFYAGGQQSRHSFDTSKKFLKIHQERQSIPKPLRNNRHSLRSYIAKSYYGGLCDKPK